MFSADLHQGCISVLDRESKTKKDEDDDPDWGSLKPGEVLFGCCYCCCCNVEKRHQAGN